MIVLPDWAEEDVAFIQKQFQKKGYSLTPLQCYEIWNAYSQEEYDSNWVMTGKSDFDDELFTVHLIPSISILGKWGIQDIFAKKGYKISSEQVCKIADIHLAENKFVGWENGDTFNEEAFHQYLIPIATTLQYI